MQQPLVTFEGPVLADWVDYNGHLRDAFYLLMFSLGTDRLMDLLGLDAVGRASTGHSLYTVECHLNYLHEVKGGAQVAVHTRLLSHDGKRLHVHHGLVHAGQLELLAASEQLLLNVDTASARATDFAPTVRQRLQVLAQAQQDEPWPLHVGRVIRAPRPVES